MTSASASFQYRHLATCASSVLLQPVVLDIGASLLTRFRAQGGSLSSMPQETWGERTDTGGCGGKAVRLHGLLGKTRRWRHLGIFGQPVFLSCHVFRVY